MALALGQHFLVVEDRAETVFARNVGRGEHGRDSSDRGGFADIERNNPPMCERAPDEFDKKLIAIRRNIVEIDGRARDVGVGRFVA